MPEETDLTDRDRLALAFDDLNQDGYLAPIDFAWTTCCNSCGMRAINKLANTCDLQYPKGYVFWHMQKDEAVFYPAGTPLPDTVIAALEADGLSPDDDDAVSAWLEGHEELMDAAMTLARSLAAKSPIALRLAKESMNRVEHLPLKEAYRTEQEYTARLQQFEDAGEARQAYLEKRPPDWKWR